MSSSSIAISQGGEKRLAMLAPQSKYSKVPLRRTKTVLPEEEFIDGLEEVVESNYFPSLRALHNQYEYLAAGERRDGRRVRGRLDDDAGSSGGGTIGAGASSHTVSEYLSTYTSEDNADFDDLQQKDLELHRRKYHYLYEEQSGAAEGMLSLYYISKDTKLSHEQRMRLDNMLTNTDGSDFDSRNILTTRDNDESNPLFESRKQTTDTWAFSVRNSLFFPPEAPPGVAEAGRKRPLTTLSVEGGEGGEHPHPFIQRKNTRFRDRNALLSRSSGLLPSPLEQPHTPSEYSDDNASELQYRLGEGAVGVERVYDYVSMTPTPLTSAAATPLGSLRYEMQPMSRRDRLAQKLESKYSAKSGGKQQSSKQQQGVEQALRRGKMTPASEAMYEKVVRQRRLESGVARHQEQGITKNLLKF